MDDGRLIEACLLGEQQAWEALLTRYSRLIYAIPLHFGFTQLVADEIFQETCVILIEKLATLRDRDRLSSWIMTVTRRACLQFLRTRRTADAYDTLDGAQSDGEALEEQLLRLERQELVRRAVVHLDERCQQLIKALFFTLPPKSYEIVASELKISVGSIGPMRARCLERVRQEILRLDPVAAQNDS